MTPPLHYMATATATATKASPVTSYRTPLDDTPITLHGDRDAGVACNQIQSAARRYSHYTTRRRRRRCNTEYRDGTFLFGTFLTVVQLRERLTLPPRGIIAGLANGTDHRATLVADRFKSR
jgi:hypothetical protein